MYQEGTAYEEFVKQYLINTKKYKNVFIWNEVPKTIFLALKLINNLDENLDDIGCDIITVSNGDEYEFIQCKNYSTNGTENSITINDLSGFSYFIANNLFINAYVYYSGKLSCNVIKGSKNIRFVRLPFITKLLNSLEETIIPRYYQIDALNSLKNVKKGVLQMPCGTGKTYVSYLLSLEYDTTIVISPLISTTQQSMSHFKNYSKNEFSYIEIFSGQRDITNVKLEKKNIICSTYDSIDKVIELINNNSITNYLLLIDEFHNLTEDILKVTLIDKSSSTIFISATPKYFDNYDYGKKFIYHWEDAIKQKYICEYEFCFPNTNTILTSCLSLLDDKITKVSLLHKAFFLLHNIVNNKLKKNIVFLKQIEECEEFNKILKYTNMLFRLNLRIQEVNCTTSKKNRELILSNFERDTVFTEILLSVHVLDEGIDIPKCESVFLTHPNNNVINLVQRISRCNRKDKTNPDKKAMVIIWTKNYETIEKIEYYLKSYINIIYNVHKSEYNFQKTIETVDNTKTVSTPSFIQHLKQMTNDKIMHRFIDDFSNIYDISNTSDNLYPINMDVVAKWLNTKKGKLKETLTISYTETLDYKIFKERDGKVSKSNKEIILLTADCFKRLCLLSKTIKAEEVRTYFLELEKLLNRYKDYIIEVMNKKITLLENNQKEVVTGNKKGIVYIIRSIKDIDGIYRLGETKKKFKDRLSNYNSANSDNMEVLFVYETTESKRVQDCVIAQIKKYRYRKRKDFYEIDLNILKSLVSECGEMTLHLWTFKMSYFSLYFLSFCFLLFGVYVSLLWYVPLSILV